MRILAFRLAAPVLARGLTRRIRQAIGRTKLKFCDPFRKNRYGRTFSLRIYTKRPTAAREHKNRGDNFRSAGFHETPLISRSHLMLQRRAGFRFRRLEKSKL